MKANNLEIQKRVEEVAILLVQGERRESIVQNTSEKWGVSSRQIDTYLNKAKKSIKESQKNNDLDYNYALAVKRYEDLYNYSILRSDFRTATQINKELASLQGLYKMQIEHSGNIQFISNLPE